MTIVTGITKTRLNLRQGPGAEYPVVKILDKNTELTVLEDLGSWLNVLSGDDFGYVHENYIEVKLPGAASGQTAAGRARSALNVRAGPGTEFAVIGALAPGDTFPILEDLGKWLNIEQAGQLGYVHEDFVDVTFPEWDSLPGDPAPEAESQPAGGAPPAEPGPAPAPQQLGRSKTQLNVRTGPGVVNRLITTLGSNTRFEVLGTSGVWLNVRLEDGREGYVHSHYVTLEAAPAPGMGSALPAAPAGALDDVPLALPVEQHLPVNPAAPLLERLVADAWNRYGSLLQALSAQMGIDPAVAVAVLAVESGGRGFGPDGRMIIRFENHVFFDQWGKNNQKTFNEHFKFNASQRWLGHEYRLKPKGKDWVVMHVRSQDVEWDAFKLAESLNRTAARMSISMGGPQIMGFNFSVIGFNSVHEMFDAFSKSEREQLLGFFNFVRGRTVPSTRVAALQALDFTAFARQYNGIGQEVKYGGLIQDVYDIFHRLTA
jgi:uncharacterized protein YgiM (DUF1202 family)